MPEVEVERKPFTLESIREVIAATDPRLWAHYAGLLEQVSDKLWQEFGER